VKLSPKRIHAVESPKLRAERPIFRGITSRKNRDKRSLSTLSSQRLTASSRPRRRPRSPKKFGTTSVRYSRCIFIISIRYRRPLSRGDSLADLASTAVSSHKKRSSGQKIPAFTHRVLAEFKSDSPDQVIAGSVSRRLASRTSTAPVAASLRSAGGFLKRSGLWNYPANHLPILPPLYSREPALTERPREFAS